MWMLGRCCMEHIHTFTVGSIQIPPFEKTSTRLGGKETVDLEQMSAKETAVCGHIPNRSMGIDYHYSKVWLWSCQVLSHCARYRSFTDGEHVGRLCVTVWCVLARPEPLEEGDSRWLCHDLTVYSRIMEDLFFFFFKRCFSMQFWLFRFLGLSNSFWKTLPGVKSFRKLLCCLCIQKIVLVCPFCLTSSFCVWMADITKNNASLALSIRTSYTHPDKCTSAVPLCSSQHSSTHLHLYSSVFRSNLTSLPVRTQLLLMLHHCCCGWAISTCIQASDWPAWPYPEGLYCLLFLASAWHDLTACICGQMCLGLF